MNKNLLILVICEHNARFSIFLYTAHVQHNYGRFLVGDVRVSTFLNETKRRSTKMCNKILVILLIYM